VGPWGLDEELGDAMRGDGQPSERDVSIWFMQIICKSSIALFRSTQNKFHVPMHASTVDVSALQITY
jgi:hypothetical protein